MNVADRARDYAEAFCEAALERWLAVLDGVAAELSQDHSLLDRLQATDVDFTQRQRLLDRVLPDDTDRPVRNLLYSLMERHDLELLPGISGAVRQRLEQTEVALVEAEVVSAVPLTDAERQSLVAKLEAQFGTGLNMHYRIDPAIVGGLIVRVGDRLIDGSLATRMAAMRQALGVTIRE
jgi:F-type H+-transporting ATPase subunit delta